jgi:hypothetical protein
MNRFAKLQAAMQPLAITCAHVCPGSGVPASANIVASVTITTVCGKAL